MASFSALKLFRPSPSLAERLKSKRTYIIPTRFGLYFGLSLIILLGLAYVYSNNLIYLTCFLLTSLTFIDMLQTNFNMTPLDCTLSSDKEYFCKENHFINIKAQNKSQRKIYKLEFKLKDKVTRLNQLSPLQTEFLRIPFTPLERGPQKVPTLTCSTTFPLGLFYSWKVSRMNSEILVYPSREGSKLLPQALPESSDSRQKKQKRAIDDPEFTGHKPYTSSDSFRQIDWKAFARTKNLVVKQFSTDDQEHKELSWNHVEHLEIEKKLSQLCLWVSECEKQKMKYQVILPNWKSDIGIGPMHAKIIYEKLALYGK